MKKVILMPMIAIMLSMIGNSVAWAQQPLCDKRFKELTKEEQMKASCNYKKDKRLGSSLFNGVIKRVDGHKTLKGTNANDALYGAKGSDRLMGMGGDDKLCGNMGDDGMEGGEGNDLLIGQQGTDKLIGGPGADTFIVRVNKDTDKRYDIIDDYKSEDTVICVRVKGDEKL